MKAPRLLPILLLLAASAGAQPLSDLGAAVGARLFYDPGRNVLLLSSDRHRLAVDLGSGRALGDGVRDFRLESLDPQTGTLSAADYRRLASWWSGEAVPEPAAAPPAEPAAVSRTDPGNGRRLQVLILDAGHGGSDPGSIGRHTVGDESFVLKEKDLTLAVVLELQKLLRAAYPDRTIVLTRSGDTYPTLEKRVQIAHAQKLGENESIVFLSVHFNASLNRKARGLELWYVPQDYERDVIGAEGVPDSVFPVLNLLVDSEYKKESRDLAVSLAQALGKELGDGTVARGLKENPWFVVRMARMPAVLAELGFITNPDEASLMRDPEYLKKLADGLYNGVASFIRSYEDRP